MTGRTAAAVAALALVAFPLSTACGPEPGPAGTVISKEEDRDCTGTSKKRRCTTEYELTVETRDGQQHTFEVHPPAHHQRDQP
ncbi:hypothetical protein [Streptomyces sp. NPDC096153]|uniref:hypothetical protein n=1 Tax=Streptomyces sp. NPDC096153 TaxID=3155548 RepID=UPI00332DADB0